MANTKKEQQEGRPPVMPVEKEDHTTSSCTDTTSEDEPVILREELPKEALEEIGKGIEYASLAITDDKPKTLKKVGKAMPWHVQALTMITGSADMAHEPLSKILLEKDNLTLDTMIDVSGVTKGGHFLDTQGYIAHNDTTIVLAYRCTTSVFDWLTNFNTTSSAWEIEEDLELGYSGFCSGFEGLCCDGQGRPRVHTGFYNNFLASLPTVRKYVEPLLGPDEPPRKLYVVGHSLGAGIATLAGCYFVLQHDWNALPHSLVNVTAGSPRACGKNMQQLVDEEVEKYSNVHFYRVVKGKDVVTTVPPRFLGFYHLSEQCPVFIDDEGQVHLTTYTSENDKERDTSPSELKTLKVRALDNFDTNVEDDDESVDEAKRRAKYQKMVKCVPKSLRDHMPDFYLQPLMQLNKKATKQEEDASKQMVVAEVKTENTSAKPKRRIFGFVRKTKAPVSAK